MRCASGALRVHITLAPTEPARVQALTVQPWTQPQLPQPRRCAINGD
jgi:hypothetical protein